MMHGDMSFLQRRKYLGSCVWVSVTYLHAFYQSVSVSIFQPVVVPHSCPSEACVVSSLSDAGTLTVPHHAQCLPLFPLISYLCERVPVSCPIHSGPAC